MGSGFESVHESAKCLNMVAMKILSAAEMQACDRATSERFGVASIELMRRAGAAVADVVQQQFPQAQQGTVICGRGNNGGDGMIAARLLSEAGKHVTVMVLGAAEELKGDAAIAWRELSAVPDCALLIVDSEEKLKAQAEGLAAADVVIDAVVGTGFTPPLRGLALAVREALIASQAPVVAVDLPSGWEADATEAEASGPVFPADAVVTFTAPKPAHVFGHLTRQWTQPVVVAGIGSPEECVSSALDLEWAGSAVEAYQALRKAGSNKGNFGHVLVVGGSVGRSGAAALTALAALRAGAGLVTAAVPRPVQSLVAGTAPELMTIALEATTGGQIAGCNVDRISELMEGKTVLALGPGLGQNAETASFIVALLRATKTPAVVDADGLNLLALVESVDPGTIAALAAGRTLVLTPHPGEMARLARIPTKSVQAARLEVAREFAIRHGVTVVLKGARTVIAGPDGSAWINTSGNPGMAKGGSGDLLTGLVAGLIAQEQEPDDSMGKAGAAATTGVRVVAAIVSTTATTAGKAAAAAVWLHGLSADMAVAEGDEHTLLASDALRFLSRAFRYHPRGGSGYVWVQGLRS